jgi:autotransporter adhesin
MVAENDNAIVRLDGEQDVQDADIDRNTAHAQLNSQWNVDQDADIASNAGNIETVQVEVDLVKDRVEWNDGETIRNTGAIAANNLRDDSQDSLIKRNTAHAQLNSRWALENKAAIEGLNMDLGFLRKDMYLGVSSAMAVGGLPKAQAGSSIVSIGAGTYGGEQSYAVGAGISTDSGHSFNLAVSYDTEEVGGSVSYGYSF